MTNDELIRQVATEIKRYHHRGTMEEALDAAKAIVQMIHIEDEKGFLAQRRLYDRMCMIDQIKTETINLISDFDGRAGIEGIISNLAVIQNIERSIDTGEDYQLLSTAPQLVDEIVEPENRHAPTTETQEGTGTTAGQ